MKVRYKVLICMFIGLALMSGGIVLGGLNELYFFSHLQDTYWNPKATNDIIFIGEDIDNLSVDVHYADIHIYQQSDLTQIQVNVSNVYDGFDVYQDNNTLVIDQPFYWRYRSDYKAYIAIYVPEDYLFKFVDLNTSLGQTTINDLKANEVHIDTSAGQLTVNDLLCDSLDLDAGLAQTSVYQLDFKESIEIDLGLGDVYITVMTDEMAYNQSVDVGLGQVEIGEKSYTGLSSQDFIERGLKNIDVHCGLGHVRIEKEGN